MLKFVIERFTKEKVIKVVFLKEIRTFNYIPVLLLINYLKMLI